MDSCFPLLRRHWIWKRSHLLASLKSYFKWKAFWKRCCISLLLNCAYFPGFLILVVVVVVVVVLAAAALGSRLPVVRARLVEHHLGSFQPAHRGQAAFKLPALLGRSTHLACSRLVWPAPGILRRFYTRIKLHILIWAHSLLDAFSDVRPWPRALHYLPRSSVSLF